MSTFYSGEQPSGHNFYSSSSLSLNDKAGYDDLIDEYATPYGRNSQYQSHVVDAPALSHSKSTHRRGPSFPLSINNESRTDFGSSHRLNKSTAGLSVDWDYPPAPSSPDEKGAGGLEAPSLWQRILPDSLACRLYVVTVLVETIIDLAIEGNLLFRFHEASKQGQIAETDDVSNRKMPVYLAIFVLAHVFQLVLAIDAVYARNTLQFVFLGMFNFVFLIYSVVQITEIKNTALTSAASSSEISITALTSTIPCIIALSEILYVGLAWKIYQEFGWKVYKFLGADRQIKKMHAQFQIFECLVKFDVFFFVGFSVQFIWLVLPDGDWERYVTAVALPVSVLLLIEGHLAARHESKWMMITFMAGCISAMVYFVYKLVTVLAGKNKDPFQLVWKSLSAFSMISIMLLVATFVYACLVMHNFGRGLKTQLAKKKATGGGGGLTRKGTEYVHRGPMKTHPNRMSIN